MNSQFLRPTASGRTATLEIRVKTVKSPHLRSHLDNVLLNVVSVQEVHGPGDGIDVSWWLLTSLSDSDRSGVTRCGVTSYSSMNFWPARSANRKRRNRSHCSSADELRNVRGRQPHRTVSGENRK